MNKEKKLAIVCTRPIQYYIPLFQYLAERIPVMVFFSDRQSNHKRYDPGFRKRVKWDIPMLSGYPHTFSGADTIRLLEAFDPDRVLIYGWPFNSHLRTIRHFKDKIWFRGDSILRDNEHPWKTAVRVLWLKWVYRRIEKAFYVGTRNKDYFLKCGLKESQLVFAPHAVDNFRFETQDIFHSAAVRRRLQIPEAEVLVLFAGKFTKNKNPFLLLEAFSGMDQNRIHLIFAGDGPLRKALKKSIKKLPNVHLLPFQNQTAMPGLYQACDLFCLPSDSETWGLSVNEAMAAGKAVLISDAAGASADLVNDENGACFKHCDADDLRSKLTELTKNKNLLKVLGRSSRKKIKNWSIPHQAQILIEALQTSSPK